MPKFKITASTTTTYSCVVEAPDRRAADQFADSGECWDGYRLASEKGWEAEDVEPVPDDTEADFQCDDEGVLSDDTYNNEEE